MARNAAASLRTGSAKKTDSPAKRKESAIAGHGDNGTRVVEQRHGHGLVDGIVLGQQPAPGAAPGNALDVRVDRLVHARFDATAGLDVDLRARPR